MLARFRQTAKHAVITMALLAGLLALTAGVASARHLRRAAGHRVVVRSSHTTLTKVSKHGTKRRSHRHGSTGGSKGSTGGSGGSTGGSGGSTGGSGGSGGSTSGSEGGSPGGSTGGSGGSTGGSGGSTGGSEGGSTGGSGGSTGGSEGGSTGGSGGSTGGSEGGSSGGWWIPPQHLTWYWQLQGTINNGEPVAAYDIDGFDNAAGEVTTLHGQGKRAICYIDVGTAENFRSDYSSFPASALGSSNGWPGEKWLDVRQLGVLEPIMTARLRLCREKGFDAVEPDNMDGYENGTGFPITAQQQLAYDEWVAGEAHALGMAVFQKNDGGQTAQLVSYFDGALDEQCNQYKECSSFQQYLAAGKPVLNAEYGSSTGSFCAADNAAGIMGARYDLNLTGATFEPCW